MGRIVVALATRDTALGTTHLLMKHIATVNLDIAIT